MDKTLTKNELQKLLMKCFYGDIDHKDLFKQLEYLIDVNEENARMRKFIDRFLDTEDLGYTFGKAMRDDAREALGMKKVET